MLPALMATQPMLNLKDNPQPSLNPYQGQLDQKKLFNFAVPFMPVYSIEIKNQKDLKKFQESYPDTPKIVYFTDK